MGNMTKLVAQAICKSRSCEGFMCCQWPGSRGRTNCPVEKGGYDDAADAALAVAFDPNRNAMTLEQAESILKRSL